MSERDAIARIRAWAAGKPLPRYSTKHFPVVDDRDSLIISFVRMGGESSPWSVALGRPGTEPTIYTVPEARNRDAVADMIAAIAPTLLRHFGHPDHAQGWTLRPTLRQVWVPNATHLAMLHNLAYTYIRTTWGEPQRAYTLNAIGRLAGWLFRESQRPGQLTVMCSTDVLRSLYVFPSDPVREAHLGFLLAWLRTSGEREDRLAAAEDAERRSMSTTLDPRLERQELDPLVAEWRSATQSRDLSRANAASGAIARVLENELRKRVDLVQATIDLVRSDPRRMNAGVASLVRGSLAEIETQYLRLEQAGATPSYVPSPETDYAPAAAAAGYFRHSEADAARIDALLQDDEELQREAIANGDAVRGSIVSVVNEGAGRKTVGVWTVQTADRGVLRIREGTRLSVLGCPKRTLIVRGIDRLGDRLQIRAQVKDGILPVAAGGPIGRLHCVDPKLRDQAVTLIASSGAGLAFKKLQRVWDSNAPGAWLTHAARTTARPRVPTND